MSYRVLVPTAGTGSRLGTLTQYVNKSLVAVANRPVLCHVIEQFPRDTEFVVALGHKGHLVREFLSLAYPDRTFFFADVDPYEGPGSGLGLSILACKIFLQQPFVFISCDTLVKEPIPDLSQNWMGYAEAVGREQYRTLEVQADTIVAVCEKGRGCTSAHKPYIGLAGIRDYKMFWDAMEKGGREAIAAGEAYGMRSLVEQGINACAFTWYDTGNMDALSRTREAYRVSGGPNILEKANEAIWFVDGQVIKFSDNEQFIADRVRRTADLDGFIPDLTGSTAHMYRYRKVEGDILSEAVTIPVFERLLEHARGFWTPARLDAAGKRTFNDVCMKFYRDKTMERVALFYRTFSKQDGRERINAAAIPELKDLFSTLDWQWLCDGQPGRFHGDFHFENILYSKNTGRFTFLDWRQEFGGSLTTGDIYYDLAKLLHGLIICHALIARGRYSVVWTEQDISFDVERKPILVECERYFSQWLVANGHDEKKVRVLTALIYLNIAALHHYPYSLLLYALGKQMLHEQLKEDL